MLHPKPVLTYSTYRTSTTNNSGAVPVVGDSANIDSGIGSRAQQDSDEQLVKDDRDAIDESNIMDSRTRGAQPTGSYSEGKDEGVCI